MDPCQTSFHENRSNLLRLNLKFKITNFIFIRNDIREMRLKEFYCFVNSREHNKNLFYSGKFFYKQIKSYVFSRFLLLFSFVLRSWESVCDLVKENQK